MNGQLILISNGIDSEPIINYLKSSLECSLSSVGMLTTASVGYKEKDYHIPTLIEVFELLGLTVSFIDIEYDNPFNILEYDLLYMLGGNPFHLLKQLREKKCKPIFEKFLSEGKIIIGASAGSMALSAGIGIAYEFTPEMNSKYKLEDFSGLRLVSESICPHYTKFKSKFSNFDIRLEKYVEDGKGLLKIEDGEAVVYAKERVYTLSTNSDSLHNMIQKL